MRKLVLILFLSVSIAGFSQYDSLNKLDEIVLYGNFSPEFNTGYTVEIITDTIINNEINSLGNFLQKMQIFILSKTEMEWFLQYL